LRSIRAVARSTAPAVGLATPSSASISIKSVVDYGPSCAARLEVAADVCFLSAACTGYIG
jgi:hypothetical protein